MYGRDPGKLSNSPNGQRPHLRYHLQLKTKEDFGQSVLGLQSERGNSHGNGKANV